MSRESFYVTTPIYYINDVPHLGHAYTTVVCDALARWQRMRGRRVRFETGTDEHGQKAARTAERQGITPQQLADRHVERYREAWKVLGISHDDFIRTTEARHARGAQALWTRIAEAGDIYKAAYEGPYCVGCEAFYPESQLVEGRCPEDADHQVEVLKEESYFFRLSKYQEPLLALYREHPEFVVPRTRLNEVASFVAGGLEDLSISRTKLKWGVPVPGDPDHVMYVWIEALSNYVTALGFGSNDTSAFEAFWPADLQVVGKDILRFHAVYWPAFLMSAGLQTPRQVLAHGWWLMDDKKMSKTRGNIADPIELAEWFGVDAVRYFLLREIRLGADGNYSEEALIDRLNADLANDLGNTLSRVTRILAKDLGGIVPRGAGGELRGAWESAREGVVAGWENCAPQAAIQATWELLNAINKLLVESEPWKLVKEPAERPRLEAVMHDAAEGLRHVAAFLAPAMPMASAEVWRRLGLEGEPSALPEEWGFPGGGAATYGDALFPRIDKKKFFAEHGRAQQAPEPAEGLITYEDFAKVELRAARVESCERHPKADRLLVLKLDDGSGAPRTVCAGIATWYQPEALVGRMVVVVANLAPRKLRGVESQGMLLAGNAGSGAEERVRVVELPPDMPPGSEVR